MKYEIEAITSEELRAEFAKFRKDLFEQLGQELPKILKPVIENAVKNVVQQEVRTQLTNARLTPA